MIVIVVLSLGICAELYHEYRLHRDLELIRQRSQVLKQTLEAIQDEDDSKLTPEERAKRWKIKIK